MREVDFSFLLSFLLFVWNQHHRYEAFPSLPASCVPATAMRDVRRPRLCGTSSRRPARTCRRSSSVDSAITRPTSWPTCDTTSACIRESGRSSARTVARASSRRSRWSSTTASRACATSLCLHRRCRRRGSRLRHQCRRQTRSSVVPNAEKRSSAKRFSYSTWCSCTWRNEQCSAKHESSLPSEVSHYLDRTAPVWDKEWW